MLEFSFSSYKTVDAPTLVALWNSTRLGENFPLSERFWRQQTEGDPDFEPGDIWLAYSTEQTLAVFVVLKFWRGRATTAGVAATLEPYARRGFIAALVVAENYQRQGLGRELVRQAEARLSGWGATTVYPGANMRHFFPGPPNKPEGLRPFFTRLGYSFGPPERDHTDLRRSLRDWVAPPMPDAVTDGRFYLTQGQPGEETAILAFLQRSFPGRWHYETTLFLAQGGLAQDITLLKKQDGSIEGFLMNYHRESQIIGPGIYWSNLLEPDYGGIGPLGISAQVRGLGLGLALVIAGIEYLHRRGVTDCVIDWTTLLDFYGRLGFQPWKQYYRVYKALPSEQELLLEAKVKHDTD